MNLVEKTPDIFSACKRKDDSPEHPQQPKKPRLVFTDLQRRTLQAIFKVCFKCLFTIIIIILWLFSNCVSQKLLFSFDFHPSHIDFREQ